MSNQNLIYLEKYTPAAKILVCEAQTLADSLRHEMVTIAHLCIVIRSFIISDSVFRFSSKNKPWIAKSLTEEFLKLSSAKNETKALSRVGQAGKPNSAYLSNEILKLMTFAEDNAKVTIKALMTELFLILKRK